MEFSSFFFHLLFFCQIFQSSNTIVSSAKVQIPAQNAPTDKFDSLIEQIPSFNSFAPTFNKSDPTDADIGKRLVQQRIKRDTDVVYIDHRQSHCLDHQRSEGSCRASYAFATIAFYEWLNCMKTDGFQAFSEQYIIDCGERRGTGGCRGGEAARAVIFVKECGFISRANYPYTGEQNLCPYPNSMPSEDMGSLYIDEPRVNNIPLNQRSLAQHLQYGPIIVTIEINDEFYYYDGGVDDNLDHDTGLFQTMLLIGHGRENGKEYWLFRNSYIFDTSEMTDYKLNKNVDCFSGEFGIGLINPLPN